MKKMQCFVAMVFWSSSKKELNTKLYFKKVNIDSGEKYTLLKRYDYRFTCTVNF